MTELTFSQTTPEIRKAIWTQWLDGVELGHIVRNFAGIVTKSGVIKVLDRNPPDEAVSDARLNRDHRYLAFYVTGIVNPMTWEPCLYVVVRTPSKIRNRALWRGVMTLDNHHIQKSGGTINECGRYLADIDEELFIEAGEVGMPAFEIDLAGKVSRVTIDFVDRSGLVF